MSRSSMKTAVRPSGADRERARPHVVRDRLEPPVRGRRDVLALGHRDPAPLVLADPDALERVGVRHASLPPGPRRASRAPAARSWSGRSRPPARGRSEGRAHRARGRRHGSRSRSPRSGLSGSPAAASTPRATTSASASLSVANPPRSSTASSHSSSPAPGRERDVAVRALAVAGPGLGREAEEVREPAGARVDVDRGGEHVGAVVEDRLGAVAVVGVDVDHRDGSAGACRAGGRRPRRRC